MSAFKPLYEELDEWNFDGDEVMLWWRDDDAVADTASLQQLFSLSTKYDLPLALAIIPGELEDSLVRVVKNYPLVQVLQHGVRHENNAPDGEKKQELSANAELDVLQADIAKGLALLSKKFDQQFLPVMVPPWNRIDDKVIALLTQLEFLGLSCFTARKQPEVAENIWLVNTHVDIINWKSGKVFAGVEECVSQLVSHLKAKRTGVADRAEPTGLMTHHLVHDQESWEFLRQLFAILDEHPAVTWLSAERAFQTKWRT
ncbi:MAG: polysaccharide deacetylase family protein [Acidiferrobacterales bacterium]|nr:polysaccharide deacetylase family protein [Acidiferrobacterales bacterium]